MTHRSRQFWRTMVLLLGVAIGSASFQQTVDAQPSPANMRSGVASGTGPSTVSAFTVPGGQYFVLTDLDWSPAVAATGDFITTVSVSGPAVRWYRAATTGGGLLFYPGFHNTTGIVFDPGTTFAVSTDSNLPGWIGWGASWSGYLVAVGLSSLEPAGDAGRNLALRSAPNPALDQAKFQLHLPATGAIVLAIFGVDGRRVRTLHNGTLTQGDHTFCWDGRDDAGCRVPEGLYFAQLNSDQGDEVKRLTLIR